MGETHWFLDHIQLIIQSQSHYEESGMFSKKADGKKGVFFMKKLFGIIVLVSIALVLISCGGGGGGGGGGGAAPAASTSETYSGNFTVNGINYSTMTLADGRYTLSGSNGTITGSYEAVSNTSPAREILSGGTYKFHTAEHYWIASQSGGTLTFSGGSISASGNGILVTSSDSSLIGCWSYVDYDGQKCELEFKNNSQVIIRLIDVPGELFPSEILTTNRKHTFSYTTLYTISGNSITLHPEQQIDVDVSGLSVEEQVAMEIFLGLFLSMPGDLEATEDDFYHEPITQYYSVRGNTLIFADDAALTQEVEVWTRK